MSGPVGSLRHSTIPAIVAAGVVALLLLAAPASGQGLICCNHIVDFGGKWIGLGSDCAFCGGMLIFLGLFGVFIVLTPPPLKLLLAAVVAYACTRIAWGLLRA